MKRSLLLTHDFPPVVGGIAVVFHHLWKYFPQERMLVLTPHSDGDCEFDRSSPVRPIRCYPSRKGAAGKIGAMIAMFFVTVYLVLFRQVREVHAGQLVSCGPTGYLFQSVFGIPCFLWLYGGESRTNYSASPLKQRIAEFLITRCRLLVTNSPTTTREFLDFGIPPGRIIEIVPAVDSGRFSPGPPSERYIRRYNLEGKKILVTVGRLVERKGHDLVLKAMSLMKDYPDLHYCIAGAGPYRGRLEELAEELGVSDRVTFLGLVDENDLPDCYRLGDIFVMPNRTIPGKADSIEGFGMTFIEAGACGRPVIGGRSGGAFDAVEDGVTGYLIDPEKPDDLAEKITYLLDNPDVCREMGRRGRERAIKSFSWKQRAVQLAERLTVRPVTIRDMTEYPAEHLAFDR